MDIKLKIEQLKSIFADPAYTFDAKTHTYRNNSQIYVPATMLVGMFKTQFDVEYWSKVKANERGVEQQVILDEWGATAREAADNGTNVHEWIEKFYKNETPPTVRNGICADKISKFLDIYHTKLCQYTPLSFETRIFSRRFKMAGTIDALFEYKSKVIMIDWKTNKKMTTDVDDNYGKMLAFPFAELKENHINEYAVQQNLYKWMLREYGINVDEMYLGYLPDGDEPAKLISIPNLVDNIDWNEDIIQNKIEELCARQTE